MDSNSSNDMDSSNSSTQQSTPPSPQSRRESIIVVGEAGIRLSILPDGHPQGGNVCTILERKTGASLLTELITSAKTGLDILGPKAPESLIGNVGSVTEVSPALGKRTEESCNYVVRKLSKVRRGSTWHSPPDVTESRNRIAPKISVFQEPSQPGTIDAARDIFQNLRPQVMVYKIAQPVATSTLWPVVRSGPVCNDDGSTDPDRLIVIVNAEDLRREGIELSRHLSWEKTCEDFVRELACNGQVVSLLECAHLIVCFSSDGVIHHDRINGKDTLYFSGSYAEGDYLKSCTENSGHTLEFNLSQFRDYSELVVAFQLIRDTALSEKIPIVVFDEFDANAGGKLGWLKYFLTPMNDGEFFEHGTTHPIGRAIFFFIGGTSSTFEAFRCHTYSETGVTAKGPDFVSRLSGYVNVRGVDPIPDQNSDQKYAIRRALILRELLKSYHLEDAIDDAVLNGILRVSRFNHGARSLSAILQMSRISGREKFERAALPSDDQLRLHVDPHNFLQLVRDPRLQWDLPMYACPSADHQAAAPNSPSLREAVAIRLHRLYCDGIRKLQKEEPCLLGGGIDMTIKEWHELEDMHKEYGRAQADDIASKLRLIKCYFSRNDMEKTAHFEFNPGQLELLARRDHERLITLRLKRGWKYGKSRDIAGKISPNLVDWSGLHPGFQALHREVVKHIPQILRDYDFEIYPLVRDAQL